MSQLLETLRQDQVVLDIAEQLAADELAGRCPLAKAAKLSFYAGTHPAEMLQHWDDGLSAAEIICLLQQTVSL